MDLETGDLVIGLALPFKDFPDYEFAKYCFGSSVSSSIK
jgi:hypothetical protein